MSLTVLTEDEEQDLVRSAVALMVAYRAGGAMPHFLMFSAVTGWDYPMVVCGCKFPKYTITEYDGVS